MTLSSVLFPAPFEPITVTNSPSAKERSTPRKASIFSAPNVKVFEMPESSRIMLPHP